MPQFEVRAYETHLRAYRVEAESIADAIMQVVDGAAYPDFGHECLGPNLDAGLPCERLDAATYAELARGGYTDNDGEFVPTIHSVRRVETIEHGAKNQQEDR